MAFMGILVLMLWLILVCIRFIIFVIQLIIKDKPIKDTKAKRILDKISKIILKIMGYLIMIPVIFYIIANILTIIFSQGWV